MLFYLVRHGQTDWNRAGKIQGTTDIPLNETGRQQAEQLATVLKERSGYPAKTRIDAVYASPLARAFQTAEILAKEGKLPLRRLTGLRERDFGYWEGKSWQQVEAEYPDEFHLWREQPMVGIPAGGESRKWSGQRDSNSRPSAPKADALPTALCPGRSPIKIALFPEKESLRETFSMIFLFNYPVFPGHHSNLNQSGKISSCIIA